MKDYLEILFSSAARVQILRLFLLNPEQSFYQRQIERKSGQPIRAVQREVARLVEMDLLLRSTKGNRVFYCVDLGFPLLAELTGLVRKATGVEEEVLPEPELVPTPPEPSTVPQPFHWMETPPPTPLPEKLRRIQMETEWDRGYSLGD